MYKTNEDKYYISKTEMEERIVALLGGRAAEKIALDDISTGASNDIEVATEVAKDMVKKYGMVGVEVKTIIDTAYAKAQNIILSHMDKLHAVAQSLLENETISEEEFERIFEEK